MNFPVRQLRGKQDADALAALERLCFSSHWSAREYRAKIDADPYKMYGIGSGDDFLVAYIVLCDLDGCLEVLNLGTHPDFRRRKMAVALLRYVQRCVCPAQGADRMLLEVSRENMAARRLYEQCGFREIGCRPNYYQPAGVDALILEWRSCNPSPRGRKDPKSLLSGVQHGEDHRCKLENVFDSRTISSLGL